MSWTRNHVGDSRPRATEIGGGAIAGLPGVRAFRCLAHEAASVPIVLAAPHGGRCYPAHVLAALRAPDHVLLRLEDRLVDCLADAVARETGACLLVAEAPRAMIDLNRAVDDVDWDMLADAPRSAAHPGAPGSGHSGHRARSGLGLVPRRLPGVGELWKGRLRYADLVERIASIHQPYHAALESLVERVREQWGAVLLIDLHSMPPLPGNGGAPAQFVVGDRFGTACDGELVASIFSYLAAERRPVAHNRPYAGGFVLDRHARRSAGVYAVQIEIDRTAYLDAAMAEPGAGFESVTALLAGMVRRLAVDVAALGRDRLRWRAAAE
jgi:N-formylglutamate amidohydrolase